MGEKQVSRTAKLRKVFGHPPHRAKTPFRAGLYARVSTQDQQTIPMQTRALREYATRRGWTITRQVKEIGSGASQRERREQLLDAAEALFGERGFERTTVADIAAAAGISRAGRRALAGCAGRS